MYQLLAYIKHWLLAANQHSLHSPFLYSFHEEIIKAPKSFKINEIELLRTHYLNDHRVIEINDLGAGSRIQKSNQRKISQIARHATTPRRFSSLIYRMIKKFEYTTIVELGTSFGINSLYMSHANSDATVYTFEGCYEISSLASNNFKKLGVKNIDITNGNIDETLPDFLSSLKIIDLAYIDANHKYEPTLNYFNQILAHTNDRSIIIIDDIHWSKEMNRAWNEIKRNSKVTVSMDLFEAGVILLNPDLPKTDLVLNY